MKQSGGISFTYVFEDAEGVVSGALAFTITLDLDSGDITIVDNQGHNYVLEEGH